MCQSKAEGGKRCAAHAVAALTSAVGASAQLRALVALASTPSGREDVERRAATATPEEHAVLERVLAAATPNSEWDEAAQSWVAPTGPDKVTAVAPCIEGCRNADHVANPNRMRHTVDRNPAYRRPPLTDTEIALGEASDLLVGATSVLKFHAGETAYNGAGLCLVSVAALSYHAQRHGVQIEAVQGRYNGEPHWWAEYNGVRLDPTHEQFAGAQFDSFVDDDEPYVAESRHPAGWTNEDLVLAEAQRAFYYPEAAASFIYPLLDELDDLPTGMPSKV